MLSEFCTISLKFGKDGLAQSGMFPLVTWSACGQECKPYIQQAVFALNTDQFPGADFAQQQYVEDMTAHEMTLYVLKGLEK